MKNFLRAFVYTGLGMAIVFSGSFFPQSFELEAQAVGTTRILKGPNANPLTSTYLTPTSNVEATTLPDYALPAVNHFNYISTGTGAGFLSPVHVDLNGDGLLDTVYSKVEYDWQGITTKADQYVLLNTGSAYNLVYVCQRSASVPYYKGDCA